MVLAGHAARSGRGARRHPLAARMLVGVQRKMLDEVMPDPKRRRGLMLVMSSPSGAGKTSISHRVLELEPELALSISVTTRPQRPGEIDGVHYRFIEPRQFEQMAARGELLEHARVYGNSYGTPRAAVEQALASGRDVLFDIDWQGAQQVRSLFPQAIGVFILPPSMEELTRRPEDRRCIEVASDDCEPARLRCAFSAMMLVLMVCGTNLSFARMDPSRCLLRRVGRVGRLLQVLSVDGRRA